MLTDMLYQMLLSHETEESSVNLCRNRSSNDVIIIGDPHDFIPIFRLDSLTSTFWFKQLYPFNLFYQRNPDFSLGGIEFKQALSNNEKKVSEIMWFKNFYKAQSSVLGVRVMEIFKHSITNFSIKTKTNGEILIDHQPSLPIMAVTGRRWDDISLKTTWNTDFKLVDISFFQEEYNVILNKMEFRQKVRCAYFLVNYYTDLQFHTEIKKIIDVEKDLTSDNFDHHYDILNMLKI
jgi:hypothetical protein